MSGRWYKRCGADFIHGTIGLTLEEKGAYSLCLDLIYDRGGPIPDDARWLAGICGVSVRKWQSIRDRLISVGKLTCEGGSLMNSRAVLEIENVSKLHRNFVENGAKGGRKRAENIGAINKNNNLAQATLKHHGREEEEKEEDIYNPSIPTEYRPPVKKSGSKGSTIPDDWEPKEKHFRMAADEGKDRAFVISQAEQMREWAISNRNRQVARKADWDLTFNGWLRRSFSQNRAPPRQANQPQGHISAFLNAAREPKNEPVSHNNQPNSFSAAIARDGEANRPLQGGSGTAKPPAPLLDFEQEGPGRWSG